MLGHRTRELARPHRNQDVRAVLEGMFDQPVLERAVIEFQVVISTLELVDSACEVQPRSLAVIDPQGHVTVSGIVVLFDREPQGDERGGGPVHQPGWRAGSVPSLAWRSGRFEWPGRTCLW